GECNRVVVRRFAPAYYCPMNLRAILLPCIGLLLQLGTDRTDALEPVPDKLVVEGNIVDAATGQPLPARIYIRSSDGAWYFPKSASSLGSAIRYERRSGFNGNSIEMHTTLSAHSFQVELFPGRYEFTIEHGKEFFPETREV